MPWPLPDSEEERLALAKAYPYSAPPCSYLFRDGEVHDLRHAQFAGRTPVLAHGSNRAPEQLARKFSRFSGSASAIPVTYVWLDGYDIVYSAHITRYGAIASTLRAAPGCRARVALTWLDPPQLDRMHETEGNYRFGHLEGVAVTSEAGPDPAAQGIHLYLSEHGCLAENARPIGMAAVAAEGRNYAAHAQESALEIVRGYLAPDMSLDAFILDSVADEALRQERIARLRTLAALPDEAPHFRQA